jgi:hypothetical protein
MREAIRLLSEWAGRRGVLRVLKHATLYNTLYYCQRSACFERFFRSSSGAQICTCNIRYLSDLFAVTASVDELGRKT